MTAMRRIVGFSVLMLLATLSLAANGPRCDGEDNRAAIKVVDGEDAPAGAYPWMVELQLGIALCGGSLIAEHWVLTAAHCLFTEPRPNEFVRVGDVEIAVRHGNLVRGKGAKHAISQSFVHPEYDPRANPNDVALLQLAVPIEISPQGRLLLAAPDSEAWMAAPGSCAVAAGWGSVLPARAGDSEPTKKIAATLQHIGLPIVAPEDCKTRASEPIDEGMICAGYPEGGRDTCFGDSGGPLVVSTGLVQRPWLLVGVVSFGEGCAERGRPGVYSRIAHFRSWIAGVIGEHEPGALNPKHLGN